MASNDIIPGIPDQANNTAFVVEAKLALDEGQLPLKVAPFATDGLRYPLFQFYSQWPYLGAAIVYKYLTPANPWIAVKLAYLTALCLAAFFAFKFAQVVGFDRTNVDPCRRRLHHGAVPSDQHPRARGGGRSLRAVDAADHRLGVGPCHAAWPAGRLSLAGRGVGHSRHVASDYLLLFDDGFRDVRDWPRYSHAKSRCGKARG